MISEELITQSREIVAAMPEELVDTIRLEVVEAFNTAVRIGAVFDSPLTVQDAIDAVVFSNIAEVESYMALTNSALTDTDREKIRVGITAVATLEWLKIQSGGN